MPINMIGTGNSAVVNRVTGNDSVRQFLGNLGFVAGATVTLISDIGGNIIVNVKDSRVAINNDMAKHIMV